MPSTPLSNMITSTGMYNDISTTVASDAVLTNIISGLTIEKTADQVNWVNGNLTYTVTITNNSGVDYTGVTIADTLNPDLITLVAGSPTMNNAPVTYSYDAANGILTTAAPGWDIANEASLTFSFQVQQIPVAP